MKMKEESIFFFSNAPALSENINNFRNYGDKQVRVMGVMCDV